MRTTRPQFGAMPCCAVVCFAVPCRALKGLGLAHGVFRTTAGNLDSSIVEFGLVFVSQRARTESTPLRVRGERNVSGSRRCVKHSPWKSFAFPLCLFSQVLVEVEGGDTRLGGGWVLRKGWFMGRGQWQ